MPVVPATSITQRARAKINLTLRVLGCRPDSFHELESLVAFADLADVITLIVQAPVEVLVSGPFGPSIAGENLVRVTLDRLKAAEPRLLLGRVQLEKHLPIAAGIGGGSADAAAVMRAVRLANPEFEDDFNWSRFAAQLGADVPVCFLDAPALMRGTGDELQALETLPALDVVLVNPQVPVPPDKTARVFRALAAAPLDAAHRQATFDHATVQSRAALLAFMAATGNDLTAPALAVVPEIHGVLTALSRASGVELAALSGGGPTCFAVFSDAAHAQAAAAHVRADHPTWWVMATKLSDAQQGS